MLCVCVCMCVCACVCVCTRVCAREDGTEPVRTYAVTRWLLSRGIDPRGKHAVAGDSLDAWGSLGRSSRASGQLFCQEVAENPVKVDAFGGCGGSSDRVSVPPSSFWPKTSHSKSRKVASSVGIVLVGGAGVETEARVIQTASEAAHAQHLDGSWTRVQDKNGGMAEKRLVCI